MIDSRLDILQPLTHWRQLPEDQSGLLRLIINGDSMMPLLMKGDAIYITRVHTSRLVSGDIVVRVDKDVVTHRFVTRSGLKLLTRGDARYWFDLPAEAGDILGKVIRVERNARVADMLSRRWLIVNRILGLLGIFQQYLSGSQAPAPGKKGSHFHRVSFWFGKKLVWIILVIFAYYWLRIDSQRTE